MSAKITEGLIHIEVDREYQPLQTQNIFQDQTVRDNKIIRRSKKIFDKFDDDHDGYIVKTELRRLLMEHPSKSQDLPEEVAKHIFEHDTDGDGRLNFEEFHKLCQNQGMLRNWCTKYRNYVVPQKKLVEVQSAAYSVAAYDAVDGITSNVVYEEQMTFCPPPITMLVFSIVEVIFFVYDIIHLKDNESLDKIGLSTNGPAAKLFIYNPWRREQAWRFVTYMFVHVGIMHIMMNLLIQVFLGTALELVHCWWRVALVYLSGVIAGSMGTSIANPNIYLAGASGGVYALITAHVATIIMNWKEMHSALVQLVIFMTYILIDAAASVYRHMYDPYDRVGYTAHLSGAIAGFLVGIIFLKNLHVLPHEKAIWWVSLTIYSSLMLAGIVFHIAKPDYFLKLGFP